MQTISQSHLRENPISALQMLLSKLKVPVSKSTIKITAHEHPDFPSLLSLSNLLDEWKLDNVALKLNSSEQLRELPTPFLSYHSEQNGLFFVVQSIINNKISFVEPASLQYCVETLDEFEKHWNGVVLVAEKTKSSGEDNYSQNRRIEILESTRKPLVLVTFGILLFIIVSLLPLKLNYMNLILIFLNLFGLTICIGLILKDVGLSNKLADHVCHTLTKTGCENILRTPAAKILGIVSWSDLGGVYFGGTLLSSLLSTIISQIWPVLGWISFSVLPYTVFSIYYQAKVAKQWCALCLGVQAIFIIEALLAVFYSLYLPMSLLGIICVFGSFLFRQVFG